MKRFIALILTFLLIIGLCNSVSAATATAITLNDVNTKSGEEFDVDLSIADNAGIAGFSVTMIFDSTRITPVSFSAASGIGLTISSSIDSASGVDKGTIYELTITGVSSGGNVNYNGKIGTLKFKAKDNISDCVTPIDFVKEKTEIYDKNLTDVVYTLIGNKVTIATDKNANAVLVLKDVAGIRALTPEEKESMGISEVATLLDVINILKNE